MKFSSEDQKLFYRVISALMEADRKEIADSVLNWLQKKVEASL